MCFHNLARQECRAYHVGNGRRGIPAPRRVDIPLARQECRAYYVGNGRRGIPAPRRVDIPLARQECRVYHQRPVGGACPYGDTLVPQFDQMQN